MTYDLQDGSSSDDERLSSAQVNLVYSKKDGLVEHLPYRLQVEFLMAALKS